MSSHEEIHKDLYERMNATDAKMSQLIGETSALVKQNDQLIGLLRKALCYMFWIIVFLIGAVVYGAIGKEGFNAVRPKLDFSHVGEVAFYFPGPADLKQWADPRSDDMTS